MYMNLYCENCGFAFGADIPDDETEENIKEIKTCPCGTLMTETEQLHGLYFEMDESEGEE